jgi:ankyrin repeat protein
MMTTNPLYRVVTVDAESVEPPLGPASHAEGGRHRSPGRALRIDTFFNYHLIHSVASTDREDALKLSALSNQHSLVQRLLAAGTNPSLTFRSQSILCIASMHGHTEVVRELIDAGADITFKDDDGRTALQWAAKLKHRDVVALLLARAKELKNANK